VYIIEALIECKKTIKYVNIEDNDSINMAIEPLCKFIKECLNLEHLNISKLKMRKTHFEKVYSSFIIAINSGSKLETLKWNYDFMSISRAAE
jgi:Ran GTPase-activating protein (RanGAP) involved in mRNA processing and transport